MTERLCGLFLITRMLNTMIIVSKLRRPSVFHGKMCGYSQILLFKNPSEIKIIPMFVERIPGLR